MLWTLGDDDFNGSYCEEGPFPITKAVSRELRNETRISDDESTTTLAQSTLQGDTTLSYQQTAQCLLNISVARNLFFNRLSAGRLL